MKRTLHGDVAAWVRLCNGEKATRSQLVFDKVRIALDFKEDLGLRNVLWGDGEPGLETDIGIHFYAGAKRLVKGDVEGALVFC